MGKFEQRSSRFLSLVLRHDPASIGLVLDENGWAVIDDLVACLHRAGKKIDRPLIETIVASGDQQRFRFSDDGLLIRANQGHSIPLPLKLVRKAPPDFLYHGTTAKNMPAIEREGLSKQTRQHVHLSADKATARKSGARTGKPVVLEVAAQIMQQHGFFFDLTENNIWLTEHVPPDYLIQRFTG